MNNIELTDIIQEEDTREITAITSVNAIETTYEDRIKERNSVH